VTTKIAEQNDRFRRALGMTSAVEGRALLTRGVAALPEAELLQVLTAVREFTAFTQDNDPWKEHDCARVTVGDRMVIWKIDYYADQGLRFGAEDPAAECYRVMTIMLAEEY
jgi:hypothetical protein